MMRVVTTRTRFAVAGLALVAVAIWLLLATRSSPSQPSGQAPPPAQPAPPTSTPPSDAMRAPIARPPLADASAGGTAFAPDVARAVKAAATPGVQRCLDAAYARNPALRGGGGYLNVVFVAHGWENKLAVTEPQVSANGFADDELVRCAHDVYSHLLVDVPGQKTATGTIESGFELR